MKMRLSVPATTREAWLTAGRLAAGAVLLAMAVSACTAGGTSVPATFTPTPLTPSGSTTQPVTRTPSPTGGRSSSARPPTATSSASARSSATARASASGSPRTSAPATRSATPAPTRSARPSAAPAHSTIPYPTAAPETGGGGTAGLQDGLLFGIGGASVLAGIGFLAMRRRLARTFGAGRPVPRDAADPDPADREPAER